MIQAWIDLRRVRELQRQGWYVVGPADETAVLMEGPEIEGNGWRQLSDALLEEEFV